MARDLRLNIQGDSSSADKAFASATAALERASRELRTAEARTDALAVKARKLAEAEERAGDKTRDLAAKTAALRKQIDETGDETGALGRKLDRLARDTKFAALATDDYRRAADRASAEAREQARAYDRVADNARQAARAVALLGASTEVGPDGKRGFFGKIGGLFGNVTGAVKGAFGAAESGASSAGGLGVSAAEGGLSTPVLGPALALAGASAAGLAAFPIGGAIGGATLAGLGGGVAAGGLAGAWMAHPEKYQPKWDALVDHVQKRWIDSSRAYGDELDDVLKIAAQTADRLPLEKMLAASRSFVRPLAAGAGNGVANFANGLADALEKAQPVVDELGPKLGDLGNAAGDALRAISMESEGGAHALGDLVDGLGYLVRASGIAIAALEHGYEKMRNFAIGAHDIALSLPVVGSATKKFSDLFWHIGGSTVTVGHALDKGAESSHKFGSALVGAAKDAAAAELATLGLNDALTQTRDTMLGMVDANIAYAQGWLDLNKELKEGTKTLDLNTQAGIDNQKAIVNQIELAEKQREQTIANSDHTQAAIDAANKKYYEQIEAIRQAAYAAHFNKDQVDALIRSLGAVPPDTKANVGLTGAGEALSIVDSLRLHLGKFAQTYTAHLEVEGASGLRSGPEHHARGGTMSRSGFSVVGEHGPELAWFPRSSYFSPHEETRKLMSMAGGGSSGGSGSAPVAIHVAAGADQAAGRLVQYLIDRGYIQAFAGGQLLTTRRS